MLLAILFAIEENFMNIKAIIFSVIIALLAPILSGCRGVGPAETSSPTVIPTPTVDPFESGRVVQAFWDALEAGDLDTALVYVDDKASCAGYCYFTGKPAFKSYLQGYLEAGFLTKISDVKSVGSIVTYEWSVYRNGNFVSSGQSDEMMQVEDGKIIYWENQHR